MLVWILIIVGVVVLDHATKILVLNFLDREEPFVIIEGVFRFAYVENDGCLGGLLDDAPCLFVTLSIVGIIAMFIYLWKFRPESKIACTALSMVIGGGIGNMIDRIFHDGTLPDTIGKKAVVDFLDFYAFPDIWNLTFNVADAFVTVGAIILIMWCVYSLIVEIRAEKKKKLAAAEGVAEELPSESTVEAVEEAHTHNDGEEGNQENKE